MYFKPSSRVHLVVIPDYGERVREMPRNELVYAADTPINGSVVRRTWKEPKGEDDSFSLRVFPINQEETPEEWASDIIPAIELHHGECCGADSYSVLHVIGATATQRLRTELRGLGFERFEEVPDGFLAHKARVA